MTIQELLDWSTNNNHIILIYFISIIAIAFFVNLILTQKNSNQLKYVMSALIYGVTVPGILAIILTLYSILFLNINLLNVNILSYFIPIIAMIITYVILNKKVSMRDIPGFGKLSALMIIITITFTAIFVLQKSHFGVFIIGGFTQLLVVFVVLFLILKFSWNKITK